MAKTKLSPPWVIYADEMSQLFLGDSEVHVVYDNEEKEIKVYVDSASKAGALAQLLPVERVYGNVALKITVVPANGTSVPSGNLYQAAFKGNEAFSFTKTVHAVLMAICCVFHQR